MSCATTTPHNEEQANDEPYVACPCGEGICQCAIEVLRDSGMQALLHASQEDVSDERLRFVPRESIIKEISPGFISRVLRRATNTKCDIAAIVQTATNRIGPRVPALCHCRKPFCTGSRVIFASLLFSGLHDILVHFIHAAQLGICDSSSWEELDHEKRGTGDGDPILHEIKHLQKIKKELFFYWVYQLTPLCFTKDGDSGQIEKLELKDKIRLPWTSIERTTGPAGRDLTRASVKTQVIGAHSAKVENVCIHPSHHELGGSTKGFALKTFLDDWDEPGSAKDNFDKELKTNNAVARSDRILPLLAAFEHRGNICVLFPWAERGDLRNIWKEYCPWPNGVNAHADWYTTEWLLGECSGIASALADIHGRGGSARGQSSLLHADIKPDNILGFRDGVSVSLKIADFGHSQVLEPGSTDVMVSKLVNARSYRAPEFDIQETVTTKYDVWSLGCLFLDFVTWALLGWEEVKDFREERLQETNDPKSDYGSLSEDTFFKRVTGRQSALSWSKVRHAYKPTTSRGDSKNSFTRKHTFSLSLQGFNRPVLTQVRGPVTNTL
ncbi:hypothetical protein PG984_006624 [Apiospora sp. TS-2023a]